MKPYQTAFKVSFAFADIIFTFIEIMLVVRFALKLFGANSANAFVDWIYQTSQPLLVMFSGIFPSPKLEGAYILEFNTLFALLVYSIIYFLIVKILAYLQEAIYTKQ